VKSDIEHSKWLFKIKDDGGIGEKCTCLQLTAINKELLNHCTVYFHLVLGKEKLRTLVTSSTPPLSQKLRNWPTLLQHHAKTAYSAFPPKEEY
jgi:hypothetical protein